MVQQFFRPTTVAEAVALKWEHDGSTFLAGGTFVDGWGKRPDATAFVDLTLLGLDGLTPVEGGLRIGAGCTIQQLMDSDQVPPALDAAANVFRNRNIRNLATIGGQLGANQHVGGLLPTLIACEAQVLLSSPDGDKAIPVADYISTMPPGLITDVLLPTLPAGRAVDSQHYTRVSSDRAIVLAAVSLECKGGVVTRPIVAAGGVASTAIRLPGIESALEGAPLPDRDTVEALIKGAVQPPGDFRADPIYRTQLAAVLVETALRNAWQEVQ